MSEHIFKINVLEVDEGYDVVIYKKVNGKYYLHKTIEDYNSLAEVFHYIKHFPLEPSSIIEELYFERLNPHTYLLAPDEQAFISDLEKDERILRVKVFITQV